MKVAYTKTDALMSPCGTYRYWLDRVWNSRHARLAIVMLNPSTAGASDDDNTIDCCVRLAAREGYGSIRVVNLFAYRSRRREVLAAVTDPVGPANDRHIRKAVDGSEAVLVAWGTYTPIPPRIGQVMKILVEADKPVYCIEMVGPPDNRQPRHPLYLKKSATLNLFPKPAEEDAKDDATT